MFSGTRSANARQNVKFRENRSNGCGDIAILPFSKMAATAILDFQKFKFYPLIRLKDPICVSLPNFIKIGQSVAEIWRIFDFSRWRPSAILDLLLGYWDRPRRVLGGLYHCAKNCWNRCTGFDNMQVL